MKLKQLQEIDSEELVKELQRRKIRAFLVPDDDKRYQITKVFVHENKLFARLHNGQDVGIPLDWVEILTNNLTPEKLTEYKIEVGGKEVYFPQLREAIGRETFFLGLGVACDSWSIPKPENESNI